MPEELFRKYELTPDLINGIAGKLGPKNFAKVQPKLERRFETKADVKALRALAKKLEPLLEPVEYEDLTEEIDEIAEDIEFAESQRGQVILDVNEWHKGFHAEFNGLERFAKAMIGIHPKENAILLAGHVQSAEDYAAFREYVESKNPPHPVLSDVRLGKWDGPLAQ